MLLKFSYVLLPNFIESVAICLIFLDSCVLPQLSFLDHNSWCIASIVIKTWFVVIDSHKNP